MVFDWKRMRRILLEAHRDRVEAAEWVFPALCLFHCVSVFSNSFVIEVSAHQSLP